MWEELGGTREQREYTDVGRAGGHPCAAGIY